MRWANLIIDFERESKRMRNYGDDIQMAAISHVYNRMGVDLDEVIRIKVSELASYDGEYVVLPINYPLYGKYPQLSPKIIPVYLGLSLLSVSVADVLRLSESQPIGCRDAYTMQQLRKAGYDAYLNGCMTLTLPKREEMCGQDKVFIIDACEELLACVPSDILAAAEFGSHLHYNKYITEQEALEVYARYCREARLVITSRLHCAVPCVAFGIPVIYACKELSFRSWWLENLLPLYDESTFSEIDWNPAPVDMEHLKELVLSNAEDRMYKAYRQYEKPFQISTVLESVHSPQYTIEAFRSPLRFFRESWDNAEAKPYVIWGLTQTADMLYDYIAEHYPDAELLGVIDMYREINYHGLATRNVELLDEVKDATVFVCAESANVAALVEFEKRQITKYVLCWEKLDYDLKKQR